MGQGYDGASVMSGRHSGVAARIKAKTNHAFYVHCNAHCLNLVLVDSTKSVPESETFFSLLQNVCVHVRLLCAPEMALCAKGNVSRCPKRATKAQ